MKNQAEGDEKLVVGRTLYDLIHDLIHYLLEHYGLWILIAFIAISGLLLAASHANTKPGDPVSLYGIELYRKSSIPEPSQDSSTPQSPQPWKDWTW